MFGGLQLAFHHFHFLVQTNDGKLRGLLAMLRFRLLFLSQLLPIWISEKVAHQRYIVRISANESQTVTESILA